jgi:hypothetical protein
MLLRNGTSFGGNCFCGMLLVLHDTDDDRDHDRRLEIIGAETTLALTRERQLRAQLAWQERLPSIALSRISDRDLQILTDHFELGPVVDVDGFPFPLVATLPEGLAEFEFAMKNDPQNASPTEDKNASIQRFCDRLAAELPPAVTAMFVPFNVTTNALMHDVLIAERIFSGRPDIGFFRAAVVQARPVSLSQLRSALRLLLEFKTNAQFAAAARNRVAGRKAEIFNQTVAEFVTGMFYSDQPMVHACCTTGRHWQFLWLAEHNGLQCVHRFTAELPWAEGLRYLSTLLLLQAPLHRQLPRRADDSDQLLADDRGRRGAGGAGAGAGAGFGADRERGRGGG